MAAVDTDVLFKGVSYGLLFDIIGAIPSDVDDVGVLGAAPFVVRDKLRKAKLTRPTEQVAGLFEEFVRRAAMLEPALEEVQFAAELEFAAQRANLNLDEGESQLCAIVIERALPWLVTGDKRAIMAFEQLLGDRGEAIKLAGKLLCLEQLFLRLIGTDDATAVHDAVCREPSVDRALTICFSCYNPEVDPSNWSEGLKSYIADLRDAAKTVLAE